MRCFLFCKGVCSGFPRLSIPRRRSVLPSCLGLVLLLAAAAPIPDLRAGPAPAADADTRQPLPRPTPLCRIVTRIVAQMMARYHYSHHPVDDEISRQLFHDYFDRIDPTHSYFLAGDIQEFKSYELLLDDLMLQGNVDFAYDVYARLLKRVRERVEYARKRLQKPFDFSKNEDIVVDRSKAPWLQTREELDALWRKRLKNDVLTEKLVDLERARQKAKAKKNRGAGKPEASKGKGRNGGKKTVVFSPDSGLTPAQRVLRRYQRYLRRLEENESMDILEIYLSTFTRVYDPHSLYMGPDTEEDFDISMKLSLQGIGAVLTTEDEYTKVVSIVPGGPADRDGRLKAGDRIIAVAQEKGEPIDVVNMPLRRVVRLIRGKAGTKVFLTVIDADKGPGSVPTVIDITRGEVKLKEQEAKSEWRPLEPARGKTPGKQALIISLPSFYCDFDARRRGDKNYKSSTRDVARLIAEAEQKHPIAGMILDLRSNGGGSLDEAISIAGLFFPKGPVVQVRDARGKIRVRSDDDGRTEYGGPLVVLVNRLSASASEIVAAALQDYHRAVLVGEESTHGKGTVQTVYHLKRLLRMSPLFRRARPGSLKFTIAKFYRVNGGSTQKKGVTPDIVLPSFTDYLDLGEAHLPHVMPWDEIAPLKIQYAKIDVDPFLPALRRRSVARRRNSPEWRLLEKEIAEFGRRRKKKTLTLNLKKRIAYQKEEEEWSKRLRSLHLRVRAPRKKKQNGKDAQENAPDLMLDEALHVLADLTEMEKGTLPATPVAPATPAIAGKEAKAIEKITPGTAGVRN